jgi:Uma2 family endonuclease
MGTAEPKTYQYTLEQYLEFERQADKRSEFIDGEIYAMAGETGKHGDISANFLALVVAELRGSDCRARTKDTKVKSGALKKQFGKGMISYPDIVVICGEPEYHDKHKDVVLNPAAIIEVLSEATEEFDRGVKFMRYRNFNPGLTDYLLVSQDEPLVEHYIRQENGDWLLREYQGLKTTFTIDSISCSIKLKDVYDRIEFEGGI